MKIQFCSDLHLEFKENRDYLSATPLEPTGDILILAGDIVPFIHLEKYKDFFSYVSDHFKQTYWIPGNHEYYHSDIEKRSGSFIEMINDNVFLVNNYQCKLDGINLVFSTLWSKISTQNSWIIQQGLSDFQVITCHGKRLIPNDYNEQHTSCISFIKEQINERLDNTIVVTHHVPTFFNYPEQYRGDVLNEAFAIELFDLIKTSNSIYWIYGHHHQNVQSFKIGQTELVTNQLGYVRYKENTGFVNNKIININ